MDLGVLPSVAAAKVLAPSDASSAVMFAEEGVACARGVFSPADEIDIVPTLATRVPLLGPAGAVPDADGTAQGI